jgi:hypothetical protein
LIGVSRVADVAMLDAIRHQPTLPEAEDVMPSWMMGVYSRSDHRARDFAQRRQIPYAFDSLEKMWERPEIQCVYISAQPRYQAELALAAIDAGKHVLCETPLALTPAEARNVLAQARQVGHDERELRVERGRADVVARLQVVLVHQVAPPVGDPPAEPGRFPSFGCGGFLGGSISRGTSVRARGALCLAAAMAPVSRTSSGEGGFRLMTWRTNLVFLVF